MRTLSLTQPWATLVAISAKKIETRSWRTSYRGELAIHAAKGVAFFGGKTALLAYCAETEPYNRVLTEYMRSLPVQNLQSYWDALPFGAIVCVVNLAGCLSTNGSSFMSLTNVDVEVKNGEVIKNQFDRVDYRKPAADSDEYAFGDYGPNRWMWFFENIRKLEEPVPCKGAQGLRDLDPRIETLVRQQL